MPITVTIPGVGDVDFPDGMPEDQIHAEAGKLASGQSGPAEMQGPEPSVSQRAANNLKRMKDQEWEGSSHVNLPYDVQETRRFNANTADRIRQAAPLANLLIPGSGAVSGLSMAYGSGGLGEVAAQAVENNGNVYDPSAIHKSSLLNLAFEAAPRGLGALAGSRQTLQGASDEIAKARALGLEPPTYPEASGSRFLKAMQFQVGPANPLIGKGTAEARAGRVVTSANNALDRELSFVSPQAVSAEDIGGSVLSRRNALQAENDAALASRQGEIDASYEATRAQRDADEEMLRRQAQERFGAQRQGMEAERGAGRLRSREAVDQELSGISEPRSAEDVGTMARESTFAGEKAASQIGGDMYEGARATGGNSISRAELNRVGDAIRKDLMEGVSGAPKSGKLPADLEALLEDVTNRGGQNIGIDTSKMSPAYRAAIEKEAGAGAGMTRKEADYLKSTLSELARDGSPQAQVAAKRLIPVLQDAIDASLPAEGQALLSDANAYWRNKSEFFDEGRPGLVSKVKKGSVEASDIPGQVVKSPQAAQDILKATEGYANHPQTGNAIRRRVIEETAFPPSAAGELGSGDAIAKLSERLRSGGPVLDILSEGNEPTKKALKGLGAIGESETAAEAALKSRLKDSARVEGQEVRELGGARSEGMRLENKAKAASLSEAKSSSREAGSRLPLVDVEGEAGLVPSKLRSSTRLTQQALNELPPAQQQELRRRIIQEVINPPVHGGGQHLESDLTRLSDRIKQHEPVLELIAKNDPRTTVALRNARDIANTLAITKEAKPGTFEGSKFLGVKITGRLVRSAVGLSLGGLKGVALEAGAEALLARIIYSPEATAKFIAIMKEAQSGRPGNIGRFGADVTGLYAPSGQEPEKDDPYKP